MGDAFELSGADAKAFFYNSDEAVACARCGLIEDPTWVNPLFVVTTDRLDFAITYDLATIVSSRFAAWVEDWPGVVLGDLPACRGWYQLTSDQEITYDAVGGGLQRVRLCDGCDRYTELFAPLLGCVSEPVRAGLCRTDQVFGSAGDSATYKKAQSPTLLVNDEYAAKLREARFAGLVIRPAECMPEVRRDSSGSSGTNRT